jgi:hypothetical protein
LTLDRRDTGPRRSVAAEGPVDRSTEGSESNEHEYARFSLAVVLSKREAFEACEACAEAERALLRGGRGAEAGRIAALFELIEARLVSY